MAQAQAPNPMNLILLAGLGIGVYYVMTRPRVGMSPLPIYPTPAQNAQAYGDAATAAKYQLAGGVIGKVFDLFSASAKNPNTGINGPIDWQKPIDYSLSSAYVPSNLSLLASSDGVVYNPPSGSAWDNLYSLSR